MNGMGEDALVARLLAQWPQVSHPVIVGPGDDCAVIECGTTWQLLKTDAMVEGQHFTRDEEMHRVGWKAIARVQSDFAAMGGAAEALVVTIFLPSDRPLALWEKLYAGMAAAAKAHGGVLCGGETSRSPEGAGILISVAGTGRCYAEPVLRSGARNGDLLYVTGHLGGSLAGHHLDFSPRVNEGQWLAKMGFATAMMDVSDGLAKDLPRLCMQSQIGARVEENKLPLRNHATQKQAMNDGEDYELLFSVKPEHQADLESTWANDFPRTPLTKIGTCTQPSAGMSFTGGWDPFR